MEAQTQPDNVDVLLAPEVKEITIGIRKAEKIKVYPLTFYDQKNIGGKVIADLQSITSGDTDLSESEYVKHLLKVLEGNLPALISKCTDKSKKDFMAEASSGQLVNFLTVVMEVNFLDPIKKGTRLFMELGNMGSLQESSPSLLPSASITDIG